MNFDFFVTDIGMARTLIEAGSDVQRTLPRTLFSTADSQLELGGKLVAHASTSAPNFINVPEMTDAQWQSFLNNRHAGRRWQRWFGSTPSAIYSIVAID